MDTKARTANDERTRKRRERILDAAFHVFSRTGYREAAVDDIAREADTSKGGIYFHFPTKESIFVELLDSTADRLMAKVVRTVDAETEAVARAGAAISATLGIFSGHRSMARLLLIDGLGSGGFTAPDTEKPVPGGPLGQLYNLRDDPKETTNRYLEKPEIVARMKATLEKIKHDGRSRN